MNYALFRNVAAVAVVSSGVALFLFFPAWYVQLVPGLASLWGEIAVGFAANRAAHALTKRGIALKGIEGEQNPTAKRMFATGNFTKLYLTYGLIFASGVALTALSVYVGAVWLGMLVIMLFFPIVLVYDMLNDYYWVRRYERETAPRPVDRPRGQPRVCLSPRKRER